jgi:hypothetical protein
MVCHQFEESTKYNMFFKCLPKLTGKLYKRWKSILESRRSIAKVERAELKDFKKGRN